jgi:hypothetical protein
MPLSLVCACGRTMPLPERSGRFRCSACGSVSELTWFAGPLAFEEWQCWRIRTGRVAIGGPAPARIEFVRGKGGGSK